MKEYRLMLFVSLLALSLSAQNSLDKLDQQGILDNFKEQEKCWNNNDIECYMNAYSKTDPIQTVSKGGVTFGYENILANYKKYFPKGKMGKLNFDDFNFRRLTNDLFFVTGRFNLKFENRENPLKAWFSVVMKKHKNKWLIITDHSS